MHPGLESAVIHCPYCGERIELTIDCSQPQQEYIEDCWVCCRPINLNVQVGDDNAINVTSRTDDE